MPYHPTWPQCLPLYSSMHALMPCPAVTRRGFLAVEGKYDRMDALLASGLHPIDILLLLACSENDTPKVTVTVL